MKDLPDSDCLKENSQIVIDHELYCSHNSNIRKIGNENRLSSYTILDTLLQSQRSGLDNNLERLHSGVLWQVVCLLFLYLLHFQSSLHEAKCNYNS